ncbi:hypothetical protein [Adhaeribacter aquaticus]|uniref:hypothetical protein n=1 Tax=Adhaeribacter aquaticus TaxID=299567 RepID=UPI0004040237|nr:hypothetical protein [Adhaeribacter aquaticus]
MILKTNTSLAELDAELENVQVLAGGYVTEEMEVFCKTLSLFASSDSMGKIAFYENQEGHIFAFHYGYKLNLDKTIVAIDYFPEYSKQTINKVHDVLLKAIKKQKEQSLKY